MKRTKPRKLRRAARKPAAKTSRRTPTAKPADPIDTLVAANAQALGLTLDPAWHGSIAFNLRLVLRHAALVDAFKLPDDAEPAPIFHA